MGNKNTNISDKIECSTLNKNLDDQKLFKELKKNKLNKNVFKISELTIIIKNI